MRGGEDAEPSEALDRMMRGRPPSRAARAPGWPGDDSGHHFNQLAWRVRLVQQPLRASITGLCCGTKAGGDQDGQLGIRLPESLESLPSAHLPCATGTLTVNVLPWPGWLSTLTIPP